LDPTSRATFRCILGLDADTWSRGRGWALWKALITLVDQLERDHDRGVAASRAVIGRVIRDSMK
jgi:hypothetical protein